MAETGISNLRAWFFGKRYAVAGIGAIFASAIATGCSSQVHSIVSRASIKPVSVSLTALAKQTPEWAGVSQFDSIALLTSESVTPISPPSLPAGSANAVPGSETVGNSAAPSIDSATRQAQATLERAESAALQSVEVRLDNEHDRLYDEYTKAEENRMQIALEQAHAQAVDNYLSTLPTLLTPLAFKRLNLELKIAALTVDSDPSNRSVAPDDQWGKLLQTAQGQLRMLGSPQTGVEQHLDEEIAKSDLIAASQLHDQMAANLASYRSRLDTHRDDVIGRERSAMGRERADLTAMASGLNSGLDQPLTAIRPVGDGGYGASATPEFQIPGESVPPVPADSVAKLRQERGRLVAQVLQETKRKAMLAAAELNIRIVNWNTAKPDIRTMALLVRKMHQNDSG